MGEHGPFRPGDRVRYTDLGYGRIPAEQPAPATEWRMTKDEQTAILTEYEIAKRDGRGGMFCWEVVEYAVRLGIVVPAGAAASPALTYEEREALEYAARCADDHAIGVFGGVSYGDRVRALLARTSGGEQR